MKGFLLSLLLALGPAGKALAQDAVSAPVPNEPDRSAPIPPGLPRPFQMPSVKEDTLANSLKVALIEVHRSVLVSLNLMIPLGGSVYDPKQKSGLAELAAALMMEGAGELDSRRFAEALADIGAQDFDVSARKDAMHVSVLITKDRLDEALRLISTMLRSPRLPSAELNRLKNEALAGLQEEKGNPGALAGKRLDMRIFGDHPYGAHPDEKSIGGITLADVKNFHETRIRPEGAVLAAGGDVSLEELKTSAERNFDAWTSRGLGNIPAAPAALGALSARKPSAPSFEAGQDGRESGLVIDIIDMPGSAQSTIRAGHLSIRRDDPDFFPVAVMNAVLGETSILNRLEQNIRETHSWAYGAGSSIDARKWSGSFMIKTDVQTDHTTDALNEILKEISRLQTEPVPAEELEAAKRYKFGMFVIGQQHVQNLANQVAGIELYGLPPDTLQQYRDRILAVTAQDVQRAARKHLHPDQLQIVIAGDAAKIAGGLSHIAPVRVFDVDGRPKQLKKRL